MAEYGFTQKEIQNYESLKQVYSSWGRDVENDYLKLCVYDLEGNLLQEKILGLDSVSLENDGDFVDLKIGQHLRDCGYTEGDISELIYFNSLGKTSFLIVVSLSSPM